MMLFDTNAVSDLFAGVVTLRPRLESSAVYFFPVITVGEYRHGLEKSRERVRLVPRFEALLKLGTILPVTETTAHHYGNICAEQDRKGRPVPANDAWIAALAREHDLPILSRDAHFDEIDGVVRLGW